MLEVLGSWFWWWESQDVWDPEVFSSFWVLSYGARAEGAKTWRPTEEAGPGYQDHAPEASHVILAIMPGEMLSDTNTIWVTMPATYFKFSSSHIFKSKKKQIKLILITFSLAHCICNIINCNQHKNIIKVFCLLFFRLSLWKPVYPLCLTSQIEMAKFQVLPSPCHWWLL